MILALAIVKGAIRPEPATDYPKSYAGNVSLGYLPASVWGKEHPAKSSIWVCNNTEEGRGLMPLPSSSRKRVLSQKEEQRAKKRETLCHKEDGSSKETLNLANMRALGVN